MRNFRFEPRLNTIFENIGMRVYRRTPILRICLPGWDRHLVSLRPRARGTAVAAHILNFGVHYSALSIANVCTAKSQTKCISPRGFLNLNVHSQISYA